MDYLQKHREHNYKLFRKCQQFLLSRGYDLKNLPKVEPCAPILQTIIPSNQPKNLAEKQTENIESDSSDFDMMAYIKSKHEQNNKKINLNQEQVRSHQLNRESKDNKDNNIKINLSQYSYSSNADLLSYGNYQQTRYQSKPLKKQKQVKQVFNSKWKLIDKNEYKNKIKIDQVIKNFEPAKFNYKIANNLQWQNHKKHEDHKLYYILSRFPNIKQFKNNQKSIIKCGLQNHNIFVCMPTGGGKSLTFQILTFLMKGVYLCILPLISLIHDQEYQAKILGIEAYSLTANTTQSQVKMVYNKLAHFEQAEKSIVIFCTPQKLNLSPAFSEVLDLLYTQNFLKRIIIDQVHCVSTWGKQFRVQYENLSNIKKRFPKTPILALTATVTQIVKQDIITKLGIEHCYFFQSSFNRPNLYYEVRNKDKNIDQQIIQILNRFRNKSGIIYCLSRKSCEQLSNQLNRKGYRTSYYHAQIGEQQKKLTQQRWMNNQIYVIIATVAFGMGINKPDVRFVIHHSMSKSLQNYYQESGRAGRDGQYAQCILFYRKLDKQSLMSMTLRNDFSTKQNKQFSTKQLAQMIKYCQDKATCRRQFQLKYLGQQFNSQNCQKTCDNCKKSKNYQDFQCIDEAKILIQTLLKIQEKKMTISKNQLISILKNKIQNKKNKTVQYKVNNLSRFGISIETLQETFEYWKVDELEQLILEFMSHDIITEIIIENQVMRNRTQNNVSNIYLKCFFPKCKIFLQQVETLAIKRQVSYKQKSNNYDFIISQIDSDIDDINEVNEVQLEENIIQDQQIDNQKKQRYKQILDSLFEDQD